MRSIAQRQRRRERQLKRRGRKRSSRRRQQAELDAQAAAHAKEAAERARLDVERARQEALKAQSEAEAARAAADAARQAADAEAQAARAEAQQAHAAVAQSEQEKNALRERLREQLSVILETRETARGLIVNLSDVLFDTGSATLKPGAREKLARVAGILSSHPDLHIEIEGHTDNVGGDDYNQRLSERRAASVQAYMVAAEDPADGRWHRRIWRKPPRGHERDSGWAAAESPGGAGRDRRIHRPRDGHPVAIRYVGAL